MYDGVGLAVKECNGVLSGCDVIDRKKLRRD